MTPTDENPTLAAQIEALADGLGAAHARVFARSTPQGLSDEQTARCTMIVRQDLVDYSFRPARFTPLGLNLRAYLEGQSNEQ